MFHAAKDGVLLPLSKLFKGLAIRVQWAVFHWWDTCMFLSISPNDSYLNLPLLRKTRRVSVVVLFWMLLFLFFSKSLLSFLLLWHLIFSLAWVSYFWSDLFWSAFCPLYTSGNSYFYCLPSLHYFLLKSILQVIFQRRDMNSTKEGMRACLRKEMLFHRLPASGASLVFAEREVLGCKRRRHLMVLWPDAAAL